jgi:hypothetical protein
MLPSRHERWLAPDMQRSNYFRKQSKCSIIRAKSGGSDVLRDLVHFFADSFRHRLQPIEVAAAKVALAPFPTLSSNPRYLATLRSNASIYKGFLPRVGLGIAW